jgi:hypothetical protein
LLIVAILVFVSTTTVFADDDDADSPDDGDTVEATQVMEEVSITFGQAVADDAAGIAAIKEAVQENAKSIPTGAEIANDAEKIVNSVYLPMIVASSDGTSVQASATDAPWFNILQEGFEGVWPYSGWRSFDNNGATGGFYCWDDDDFWPYFGFWSAWPANGCANGVDPQFFFYPHNMNSWMTYGPFSLVGATQAQLNFRYWNDSEKNFDWFWWCASGNGVNYGCKRVSGFNNWKKVTLKLNNVPIWGDLRGDPTVWIAFIFTSDGSVSNDGPFVDSVIVKVK